MDIPEVDFPCNIFQLPELKAELHEQSHAKNISDILFANIRSIRKNFDDLIELLEILEHKFTLIVLNETWLDETEHEFFKLDGYEMHSVPRNRHGGGVLIYSRQHIQCYIMQCSIQ